MIIAGLGVAVVGMFSAGCGGDDPTARKPSRAVIVVPVPGSGPARKFGRELLAAARTRLKMLGGEAAGIKVELRSVDQQQVAAQPDPEGVARLAAEAVADPETVAWLGGIDSNTTALALPVLNASGVMVVSASAAATPFTVRDPAFPGAPGKYFPQAVLYGRSFARTTASDGRIVSGGLRQLAGSDLNAVYAVDSGDTDGVAFTSALRQHGARAGVRLVGSETVIADDVDWLEVIARARAAGADAIAWGSASGDSASALWSAVSRTPGAPSMIAGPAVLPPELDALPDVPRGTVSLSGLRPVGMGGGEVDRFSRQFRNVTGHPPGIGALNGAEALDLIMAAIRAGAATLGPQPSGDDLRGSVSRRLHSVRRLKTLSGTVEFDGNGDVLGAPVFARAITAGGSEQAGARQ